MTERENARDWDVWAHDGTAPFEYDYDQTVTLIVEEGGAVLTFQDGQAVEIAVGTKLTIFAGNSARWQFTAPIQNRYQMHSV